MEYVEKVPYSIVSYPYSVGKEGKRSRVPFPRRTTRKKLILVVITTMRQFRSTTLSREISFQFIKILKDDVTLE